VTGTSQSTGGNPAVGITSPTSTATCAAGKVLLGGGASVTQSGSLARGAVSSSAPTSGAWTATAVVTVTGGGTVTITAYAICSA
jgi:hypothetical protein